MKNGVVLLVVGVIAASLLVSPCLAREGELRAIPAGTEVRVIQLGDGPRPNGDICQLHLLGEPAYVIGGWLQGDEVYKIYCDPQACPPHHSDYNGLIPTYFIFYLYWYPLDSGDAVPPCHLDFALDMEHPTWPEPDCPYPGEMIWSSGLYGLDLPEPGLYEIAVPLDGTPCIAGPFFFSIYFAPFAPCPDYVDIVLFDTEPCVPCSDYNDWGEGWYDFCTELFGVNVAAFVEGVWECDAVEGWVDLDGDGHCGPDEVILEETSETVPVDIWLDSDCVFWDAFEVLLCWDESLEFSDWLVSPDLECAQTGVSPAGNCASIWGTQALLDHGERYLGTIWLHNVLEQSEDAIWIEGLHLTRYGQEAWYIGEGLDWCPGYEMTSPVEGRTWGAIKAMYR